MYYSFDSAVKGELLMDTNQVIENIGFQVRTLSPRWDNPSLKNKFTEDRNIWVHCYVHNSSKDIMGITC